MTPTPLPEIPIERLALLDNAVLTAGSHVDKEGNCARELIHLIVTGDKDDATPACLTRTIAILPRLNDGPWRDDTHRTSVLLPYIRRLLQCPRDDAADRSRAYAVADYVVRVAAPERAEAWGRTELAAALRAITPITDAATARAARQVTAKLRTDAWNAYLAAAAADAAAVAAAAAVAVAAAVAADAAVAVAAAAAVAADAAYYARSLSRLERHGETAALPPQEIAARMIEQRARTLLDIIVDPRHLQAIAA